MGTHPQLVPADEVSLVRRNLRNMAVVTVLAIGFFLVPALQGINLVADQSAGVTQSTRSADQMAAAEVLRLLELR